MSMSIYEGAYLDPQEAASTRIDAINVQPVATNDPVLHSRPKGPSFVNIMPPTTDNPYPTTMQIADQQGLVAIEAMASPRLEPTNVNGAAVISQASLGAKTQPITQIPAPQPPGYVDKMCAGVKEALKALCSALVVATGMAIHWLVSQHVDDWSESSFQTRTHRFLARLLYPLGMFVVIWNMKVFN